MLYYSLSIALSWAALSTYWDTVFGYDNFYAHGFGVGMAMLPMIWLGVPWYLIVVRSLLLGLTMGLWSKWWELDWAEEMGRGALIVATLPILFI